MPPTIGWLQVINVDKNERLPPAIEELKADRTVPKNTELRTVKYLNNIVEQDHPCDQTIG